ncbi:MAG: endopeptidase La [Myxococcales bacterium FL481]|nr:MAG: endopeptidase La [Myxococcales bacterium FL481]
MSKNEAKTAFAGYPLLPLRQGVILPGTMSPIAVARPVSLDLLRSVEPGDLVVVGFQIDGDAESPVLGDLHPIATLARVHRIEYGEGPRAKVLVEGLDRCSLTQTVQSRPFPRVLITKVTDTDDDSPDARALAASLRERVAELQRKQDSGLDDERLDESSPGRLADRVAAGLPLDRRRELEVLMTLPVAGRLRLVARLLAEAVELDELRRRTDQEVRQRLTKQQHDAILRERIRAMQQQLGDDEEGGRTSELRERLAKVDLPEEARKTVDRELERLERLNPNHPEFAVAQTYLELIADLPWNDRAQAKIDLDALATKLEEDHYGLHDVKRRVLEHLAVLELAQGHRGTVLCLSGPPGVGKTSIGRSIAEATGRPFVRIALGGVRDEAEIRGHRRTYIGALPGRIISAIRKAGVKNPVVLLDEVDKLAHGFGRSPEAALLELLDPEQNNTFTDHYLELPFDLSEVMFVCTANDLSALSPPLRDRLEIVELSGYTPDEKLEIAKRHLLPKALEQHGLLTDTVRVTDEALDRIIGGYTREAGVRQLGRMLAKLCRSFALDVAKATEHRIPTAVVEADDLAERLGRVKFFDEVAERTTAPGVATGLAWTPFGGDILFVETSRMPGKGRVESTGQLGDVMKESVRAALTYVRSHADTLGVEEDFLEHADLHVHIPAGAVPKDGPSAGVTIFSALTSLLCGRRVRSDTAMTGEATLRGRVLPVGGIRAKVLAAHRAGIRRVILPRQNEADLDRVPEEVRSAMTFIPVDDMAEVLAAALEAEPAEPAWRPTAESTPTATVPTA